MVFNDLKSKSKYTAMRTQQRLICHWWAQTAATSDFILLLFWMSPPIPLTIVIVNFDRDLRRTPDPVVSARIRWSENLSSPSVVSGMNGMAKVRQRSMHAPCMASSRLTDAVRAQNPTAMADWPCMCISSFVNEVHSSATAPLVTVRTRGGWQVLARAQA